MSNKYMIFLKQEHNHSNSINVVFAVLVHSVKNHKHPYLKHWYNFLTLLVTA